MIIDDKSYLMNATVASSGVVNSLPNEIFIGDFSNAATNLNAVFTAGEPLAFEFEIQPAGDVTSGTLSLRLNGSNTQGAGHAIRVEHTISPRGTKKTLHYIYFRFNEEWAIDGENYWIAEVSNGLNQAIDVKVRVVSLFGVEDTRGRTQGITADGL